MLLLEHDGFEKYFEQNSRFWTKRAWRLISLAGINETYKNSFDHLELIGLTDEGLWKPKPFKNYDWLFWCLYRLLSQFDDKERQDIFLRNNRSCAKILVQILSAITMHAKSNAVFMQSSLLTPARIST